jgi:hypothetical protein
MMRVLARHSCPRTIVAVNRFAIAQVASQGSIALFVEAVLPHSVKRTLSEDELDAYRAPFSERAYRVPTLVWPRRDPHRGHACRCRDTSRGLRRYCGPGRAGG